MTKWIAIVFCFVGGFSSLWAQDSDEIGRGKDTAMVAISAKSAKIYVKKGVTYMDLTGVSNEALGVLSRREEAEGFDRAFVRIKSEDFFGGLGAPAKAYASERRTPAIDELAEGATVGLDAHRPEFAQGQMVPVSLKYSVKAVQKTGANAWTLTIAPVAGGEMINPARFADVHVVSPNVSVGRLQFSPVITN